MVRVTATTAGTARADTRRADAEFCSRAWDELDESVYPVWGTATQARFWVGLEQPGPWGAKALTESRLDPQVGAALEEAVSAAGGRILLIRSVGDHRGDEEGAPQRVFLAGGAAAGEPWLLTEVVADPAQLLRLPWASLADGDADSVRSAAQGVQLQLEPHPAPVLFVCTNSKRDRCCAMRGRKVATYAAGERGDAVWECTHTGGHRYAPTGVVLPYGAMFARLDGPTAVAALDAAGEGRLPSDLLVARQLRGLAHLDEWAQAAEAHVRAETGETAYGVLTVDRTDDDADAGEAVRSYVVRHADGRTWPVTVRAERHPAPPVSCGKSPADQTMYAVTTG